MSYTTFTEAAAFLRGQSKFAQPSDLQLLRAAGGNSNGSTKLPKSVVMARLVDAASNSILGAVEKPPTDGQCELIGLLCAELDITVPKFSTRSEASAWIEHLIAHSRAARLEDLKVEAGDVVTVIASPDSDPLEVSSIGGDGRVYFRTAGSARPDQIAVVARKADEGDEANELRVNAKRLAATRNVNRSYSVAVREQLQEYEVDLHAAFGSVLIEQLERTIDSSENEAPVQEFLEKHPGILASTLGGHHARFERARVSLGGKYEVDFAIAEADSRGFTWTIVELESPLVRLVLKNSNEFAKLTRHGVSQIQEWRVWIQENLELARRAQGAGGVGLFKVQPQAHGLLIIGREHDTSEKFNTLRSEAEARLGISVRTYDWLVRVMRERAAHGNLPRAIYLDGYEITPGAPFSRPNTPIGDLV